MPTNCGSPAWGRCWPSGGSRCPPQVYRLVTGTPERLSLRTLVALCDILECTPSDLIEPVAETARPRAAATGSRGPAPAGVHQPRRAEITRGE